MCRLQVEVRLTGSATAAAPAWVRLVAAVQARRHGGYTLQLHSGLRLRNGTEAPLQVGWRSPQQDAVVLEVCCRYDVCAGVLACMECGLSVSPPGALLVPLMPSMGDVTLVASSACG